MCTLLHKIIYEALLTIPEGKVVTYKLIAERLGDRVAARTVATILSENTDPSIPCYKVVMSDGRPGGYAFGGEVNKVRKLKGEGVPFKDGRVDLSKALYEDIDLPPILEKMKRAQERIATLNRPMDYDVESVIGVDVSYRGCKGLGVAVLMSMEGTVEGIGEWYGRVRFPYVPTYLAFREAPFMYRSIKKVGKKGLLLVDGHGEAHPRKAGEAVHIGAMVRLPSIGVAKRPLFPHQKPTRGSYISTGFGKPSLSLVERVWFKGKRQPEALEIAHREATRRIKEMAL